MGNAAQAGAEASAGKRLWSGESWRKLLDKLDDVARRLFEKELPKTAQMGALAHRHLLRLLRAAEELIIEFADAERPALHRMFDLGMAFALDNPDTLYHRFPVLPHATYRLRAERAPKGKAPHFISLSAMVFETDGLPRMGADLNNANGSLTVSPEGSFDVVIGGEQDGHNWLRLEREFPRQLVFLRQTFQDWAEESPLHLQLERVDDAALARALSAEHVTAALELIPAFVEFHVERWIRNTLEARARGENVLPRPTESPEIAGLTGQHYAQGFYKVPAGQALLVSFEPPRVCGYWGLQLANWLGESLDYAHRRVSINSHQAVLDRDGLFRAILAAEDPGVPNWLDIGGGDAFSEGLVIVRFTECAHPDEIDTPQTRLLSLDRLRDALPAEHPRVSPDARQREMRTRRRHLQRRLGE